MSRSVGSEGGAVSLGSLVCRARQILAELPPVLNCDASCRATRVARAAVIEAHGECDSWPVFSQYIPLLAQVSGRAALCRTLAEDLRNLRGEGCTDADIRQVAGGHFGSQGLSTAALNALAYALRVHVSAYVMGRLIGG